jgi:hypothetical protein
MTEHRVIELTNFINNQNAQLQQLKYMIEIALSTHFLDNSKSAIHTHFCFIDDKIGELIWAGECVSNELK